MVGVLLGLKGACVFDADQIGRRVLEPDGEAFEAVAEAWPDVVEKGTIDRSKLARVVFSDPSELGRLEEITHPAIRQRLEQLVEDCDAAVVVVEVPLLKDLLGPGWIRLAVDAPSEVRRRRLRERGMGVADIDRRINAQPSREQWLASADLVVCNSGSRDELAANVELLWKKLQAMSDAR